MIKYISSGMLTLLFIGVVAIPSAEAATTSSLEAMLAQIKTLTEQLTKLQKELAGIRGDVRDVLKEGLKEGMSDEDIRKIQEILATDSTIYPEGKMTGYFGPLTKEAIKRFQKRHGLEETGIVDEETRDMLEEYRSENKGHVPPGLLKAPGIMKKVEDRFKLGCDKRGKGHGYGFFCKKFKEGHDDDEDDEDDDSDEDEDEDEDDDSDDGFDVEVEIEHGSTTVEFTVDGDDYVVTVDSTDIDDVLEEVADELDTTVSGLDDDLVDEIKREFNRKDKDSDDKEAEDDAEDAIDEAEDAIKDAEDAIDDADGDTDEAEDLLADAEEKLEDAEEALDDEDYADAEKFAKEAEALADDAVEAL